MSEAPGLDPTLASGQQAPEVANPASDDSARTILDPSSKGTPPTGPGGAAAERPAAHTPPAGMPPGQLPPGIDPDAATVLPESVSSGAVDLSKELMQTPPIGAQSGDAPAGDPQAAGDSSGGLDRTIGPGFAPEQTAPRTVLAKLVSVQRDGSDGDVHEIDEESFDIGRTSGQLSFAEDGYLSARHCRFVKQDDHWEVMDLDSCNGVYRRFVEPRDVPHRSHLLLGKQVLRFEKLSDAEAQLDPGCEHGVMLFGSPTPPSWGRLCQVTVAGVSRDVYHLTRTQVTLGREDGDLTFPDDEFMSRKHMAISHIDGKVVVQDLGSSNGTFMRVEGRSEVATGDVIRIGDQLLRFEAL